MHRNTKRITAVLEYLGDHGKDFVTAEGYVEPGYADPDATTVIFANWNDDKEETIMERTGKLLERLGAETEWSDEWATCDQCYKAVRTQGDSYSWKQSFVLTDGGIDCRECLLADPEDYVRMFLLNNVERADTFEVDLDAQGFKQLIEGESGFHPGQNDTPAEMLKQIPAEHDFAFQIDDVGQFDVGFSVWVRPHDYEAAE